MRDLPFIASMLFTHVQSGADRYRFPPFHGTLSDFQNFKLSELKSGKWFGESVNILSE